MARALGLAAVLMLIVSCWGGDGPDATPTVEPVALAPTATPVPPTATPSPTPSPTPAPTPTPSPTPVLHRSTLTGAPLPEPPPRPVAVQIDNAPNARPQTGLSQADLVYETPTEAMFTRFTALYQTTAPEVVGPVRSARLVDLDVVPMHDAMLAFSGASIEVYNRLGASGFDLLHVEGNAVEAGWRDWNRYAPHNLYTSIPALRGVANRYGWSRPSEAPSIPHGPLPEGGEPSTGVQVPYDYGAVDFTYDPSTQRFVRSMSGAPHVDPASGEQIAIRNVVLVFTSMSIQGFSNPSHSIDLQGSGQAWIFRDGKQYVGQWTRNGPSNAFHFTDNATGEALSLAEGKTWICIVPQWVTPTAKR